MPSAIRRSANSVTMMASSTSMPTARIRLNSTTMLTVSPASDKQQDAEQEGGRDRQPDQQRGAARQRIEDDDEDQDDGDHHMVLQVAQQLADRGRLVLAVGHHRAFRQPLGERVGDRLHLVDGLHQVGASALLDLDGDRRLAVQPRHRLGVLVGRADGRQVLRPHHGIGAGDDRQVGDVLGRLDERRHLDRVLALRTLDVAGRD